jgi:hypothetical protein
MRKQMKAALVGMVLAAVVFLGTPAKAACGGACPDGFSSLDWSCGFIGCDISQDINNCGEVTVSACHYYCQRMYFNPAIYGEICDSRGESPKPTEPADNRNTPVNNSRSDSK